MKRNNIILIISLILTIIAGISVWFTKATIPDKVLVAAFMSFITIFFIIGLFSNHKS